MSDLVVDRKYTFKLTFFKNLNAFEIYKCISERDHGVDKTCKIHDGEKEWDFKWGDNLIIDWEDTTTGPKHFLKFRNKSQHPKTRRSSPIFGHENEMIFEITKGDSIILVEGGNDTAEWEFDFCWGASKEDRNLKSIDPKAKIKETGT